MLNNKELKCIGDNFSDVMQIPAHLTMHSAMN